MTAIPDKDPQKLAEIHERIFGEQNREVVDARARILDAVRNGGAGVFDALDALERAVDRRTANTVPGGPVETLTTFHYMIYWLRKQHRLNPRQSPEDLVWVWAREHPEYTHDTDPRGRLVFSRSTPIQLDGDQGHITVAAEELIRRDGTRNVEVQILRLPRRALSWREAREVAEEILRSAPVAELKEEDDR